MNFLSEHFELGDGDLLARKLILGCRKRDGNALEMHKKTEMFIIPTSNESATVPQV